MKLGLANIAIILAILQSFCFAKNEKVQPVAPVVKPVVNQTVLIDTSKKQPQFPVTQLKRKNRKSILCSLIQGINPVQLITILHLVGAL